MMLIAEMCYYLRRGIRKRKFAALLSTYKEMSLCIIEELESIKERVRRGRHDAIRI
jgi:hypothetical protein